MQKCGRQRIIMNNEMKDLLLRFINLYEQAVDKEAFIKMWKETLFTPDEPLTLRDAYDAVYGEALAQL